VKVKKLVFYYETKKNEFRKPSFSWLADTSLYHVKICLMCPRSVLLQNAFETTSPTHHSLMPHACETFRHASLQIKCTICYLLFEQTVSGFYLTIFP